MELLPSFHIDNTPPLINIKCCLACLNIVVTVVAFISTPFVQTCQPSRFWRDSPVFFYQMSRILHDAQHGFRKHRSTETQLIQLIDNLAHNIDNRIQTDAILLDFQKAFDKVPHQRLLYKLAYYGISPQAHNWVQSFLTNRTQQVLLEGNMSSPINVTSGVPQGSVLGPLLFLIYINDLPDYIQNNSTVKMFADDTIIYHPITNQQDTNALQEDLDALQRWESDWLMHFHPQKCQTMHITNKRNIIQSTYTIHNHNLQSTNTAKYLEVSISTAP